MPHWSRSFNLRKRSPVETKLNDGGAPPVSHSPANTEGTSSQNLSALSDSSNQPESSISQPMLNVPQSMPVADQSELSQDQHALSTGHSLQNTSQPTEIANQPEQNTEPPVEVTDKQTVNIVSSTTSTIKSSSREPSISEYDSILYQNSIKIDSAGYEMDFRVRGLVDYTILVREKSTKLSRGELKKTVQNMDQWGRSTEAAVSKFLSSCMFPVDGPEIAQSGKNQWTKSALPERLCNNASIPNPEPNWYIGYSVTAGSRLSRQQIGLINEPRVQEYVQPGQASIFPFLIVELVSEATGGTLLRAEHRAAVSGAIAVGAIQWLYKEAEESIDPVDSAVFSMAVSGRLVVLSVHWYSPLEDTYYMSKVKSFVTSEEKHVQKCNHAVENIVSWALGHRLKKVIEVLDKLHSKYYPAPAASKPSTASIIPEEQTQLPEDQELKHEGSKNLNSDAEELRDETTWYQQLEDEGIDYPELFDENLSIEYHESEDEDYQPPGADNDYSGSEERESGSEQTGDLDVKHENKEFYKSYMAQHKDEEFSKYYKDMEGDWAEDYYKYFEDNQRKTQEAPPSV